MINTTIEYFNEKAEKCFKDAFTITERTNQDHFLGYLKPGAGILDFGCGSGRDTAYFREKGFTADAADGSSEMCRLASEYLQTPVACMEFNELDAEDLYDGIWASASIMHLEYEKLKEVFPKMIRALKKNGILYVNFKYGDKDGFLGKRYYTYMTEERFQDLLKDFPQLTAVETGTFGNEHPDQPDFRWLYAYLRKTE
jgi:SAM-dependent methyltransferase